MIMKILIIDGLQLKLLKNDEYNYYNYWLFIVKIWEIN